jgi:tRNA uridine 5-carboxymethylaminomethyl modification enzyme
LGCCSDLRKSAFLAKQTALAEANEILNGREYTPKEVNAAGIKINQDGTRRTAMQVLAFPDSKFEDLIALDPSLEKVAPEIRRQVEKDALYANYIQRQQRDVDMLRKDEAQKFPADFDFNALEGLSNEMKLKLSAARPASLGQAARIDGITPAALTLLMAHLRRAAKKKHA